MQWQEHPRKHAHPSIVFGVHAPANAVMLCCASASVREGSALAFARLMYLCASREARDANTHEKQNMLPQKRMTVHLV